MLNPGKPTSVKGVNQLSQKSISSIRNALQTVCTDPRINQIILFGSHALGLERKQSDIDLYLDSNGQISGLAFFSLKAAIEDALETEIDLLPDLDVVPGSLIENEIRRFGVTVFAR